MDTDQATKNSPQAEKYIRLARSIARRFSDDLGGSDAFGDALLALVEASKSWLPGMTACFSTYARRCIINALVSSRRKQLLRRTEHLAVDPVAPTQIEHVDPCVIRHLMQPPENEQERRDHEILMMHYLEGKSFAEIGSQFGVTKMAAFYAAKRGIARIRRDHAGLLASDCVGWELPDEG